MSECQKFTWWSFLQESDGSCSWGRVFASFTMSSAIFSFIYVVLTSHSIPDPIILAGLSAWGVHPYLINKGMTVGAELIRPGSTDKI